jgi:hypothetical protein
MLFDRQAEMITDECEIVGEALHREAFARLVAHVRASRGRPRRALFWRCSNWAA